MGIKKDGQPSENFTRGMELLGKYTLFGEGARGSLSKQLIAKFKLDAKSEVMKFGLGIKELWQVDPKNHQLGLVQHTFGWPLKNNTGGGAFLYHLEDNKVAVGLVVHLDYKNPYLSPFEEFQRFKTHPKISDSFKDAKRISYGARVISEGGWQSVPKLSFPGGALIGCAAGFVNLARIKGSHNAVLSAMLAADEVAKAINDGRENDDLTVINDSWRTSDIGKDLKPVRNVKPLISRLGTLRHTKNDSSSLEPASKHQKIAYPKPDNILTFDRPSSVFLSNSNHEKDQPLHLHLQNKALQKSSELAIFAGPSVLYCPAGVY